mmetsp:Transcript_39998/g.103321  ORF Transcript_39998/g.103321 Transcript_39998/m.103321 type:complete len:112 (-) Transcript_39998:1142-1477(-)
MELGLHTWANPHDSRKVAKSVLCRKPAIISPEGNAISVSRQLEQVMKEKYNMLTKANAPTQLWPLGSLQQAIQRAPLDRPMTVEELNKQVVAEKMRQINFDPFTKNNSKRL